jgi:translocator protein
MMRGRRPLAAACFAGTLVVNGLANSLPLGGRTTGELSALYPNLIVPAGGTFSIWGIIYLLLAGWAVAQFLADSAEAGRDLAPAFALSSVLNAGWLLAWHHGLVTLSVVIMVALLGILLHLNHTLAAGRLAAPHLARAAFGVYLGWIIVATVVNVTAWLVALGWGGAGVAAATWATVLVLVGAGIGLYALARLRNPYIGGAVAWALTGIAVNRWEDHPGIAWTAAAMALVVGVATVVRAVDPQKLQR